MNITAEITCKFTTSFKINVFKHVEEVLDEASKTRLDESMPDSWFQLIEKFTILYLNKVIIVSLLGIELDAIIKLFAKVFTSCFLKLSKPELYILNSCINNVLKDDFLFHQSIDRSHEERENDDTKKFYNHLKSVFF